MGGKKKRERINSKKQNQQQVFPSTKSSSDGSVFDSCSRDDAVNDQSDDAVVSQSQQPKRTTRTQHKQRFSVRDLYLVKAYLMEYKRIMLLNFPNSGMASSSSPVPSWDIVTTRTKIGGVVFPRLAIVSSEDDDITTFDPPYLCLSSDLSSKQRRDVHRLATEVGLFHCGYGGNKRFIAVSVFSDGLKFLERKLVSNFNNIDDDKSTRTGKDSTNSYVDSDDDKDLKAQESSNDDVPEEDDNYDIAGPFLPVQKYKPWICRKKNGKIDRVRETKEGKDLVYQLFDQPSLCLREGIDRLDLNEVKGKDLSHSLSLQTVCMTDNGCKDDDSFLLVDSVETMKQCLGELRRNRPSELAFDVECYNKSKYVQVTCLIQLATNHGKDYVIDVLADEGRVWEMVNSLSEFFADPSIVKVGHAIGGLDVQCLHRDFGIFVVNAFDTYVAASMISKLRHHGLAKVCRFYGLPKSDYYDSLKEKYQNSDWTRRPLPEPAVLYARYDVHYLLDLRQLLIRDLVQSDDQPYPTMVEYSEVNKQFVSSGGIEAMRDMLRSFNEEDGIEDDDFGKKIDLDFLSDDDDDDDKGQELTDTTGNGNVTVPKTVFDAKDLRMNLALMAAISKSQDACLGLWRTTPEPPLKNSLYQSMIVQAQKDDKPWTVSQLELYDQMAHWREKVAEEEECLPGFVCALEFLACVALKRPVSEIGLRQIMWHLPELLIEHDGKYAKEILAMVQKSRSHDKSVESTQFLSYDEYQESLGKARLGENDRVATASNLSQSNWILAAAAVVVIAIVLTQVNRRT